MKTLIVILFFLFCISCFAQNKSFADRQALKFLTGHMFYEKESDNSKLASGFFLGAEYELPMNSKSLGSSFVAYFVPELNYWTVENSKNVAFGLNFRGKFKAGSTRPYLDIGVTINRRSRADVDNTFGGINAGAGIDIQLGKSNISVVTDLKVRTFIHESKIKAGVSLTPGIRIAF